MSRNQGVVPDQLDWRSCQLVGQQQRGFLATEVGGCQLAYEAVVSIQFDASIQNP